MSHAHDNTMLARLGFRDVDRGVPEHDMACQYMGQPAQIGRLVEMILRPVAKPLLAKKYSIQVEMKGTFPFERTDSKETRWRIDRTVFEKQIIKGRDKYRTTIGFADLFVDVTREDFYRIVDVYEKIDHEDWWSQDQSSFLIEVKANPVSASEILRQVGLYREYLRDMMGALEFKKVDLTCIAATLYPLAPADRAMLRSQGVYTIRLGEPFQAWLAAQRDLPANESPDEVF